MSNPALLATAVTYRSYRWCGYRVACPDRATVIAVVSAQPVSTVSAAVARAHAHRPHIVSRGEDILQ